MRGRNKTPAERALELICAKAGLSFEEFETLLLNSQGDKATIRSFPKRSYSLVKNNYLDDSSLEKAHWLNILNHVTKPKDNFGKD